LEKWLQSPALSGLARSLFSQTVSLMKNSDPPLTADLDSIDNILSMRLKANQLNAHVENINAIAKRIPTAAIAHHIYKHLLREALVTMDAMDATAGDYLKMIHAVHAVLADSLSANGIAASLMNFLYDRPEPLLSMTPARFVRRVCDLLHAVAKDLGASFNGFRLLSAISEFRVPDSVEWTRSDEENRARLMFHCAILCIQDPLALNARYLSENNSTENGTSQFESLQKELANIRKILLQWFCQDFARFCPGSRPVNIENGSKVVEIVGAGTPDYASILDGVQVEALPKWLLVLRAILFLESPDSPRLQDFLHQDRLSEEKGGNWLEESARIRLCNQLGTNVDDELIWIVLSAATRDNLPISPSAALVILEHVFHGCNKATRGSLLLQDPRILWELYRLVECRIGSDALDKVVVTLGSDKPVAAEGLSAENGAQGLASDDLKVQEIPRLAYPGLWWRATVLALIMCGASPAQIGSVAWNEHPTLRALIKMVTSDRYRFPTVDCDDDAREEMKKTEQDMRDEEATITEILFLPPKKPRNSTPDNESAEKSFSGQRASRRQKEKREKMLKKQKEKEAHEALKEANRRKKQLRAAQKSIMLWDPRKGPRKPPKESADLIFSVGELFDLPRTFQRTTEPDFLLMTIGNTSRGAIERAYDWLIPIISVVPETIVRLPASASCFLLLRAYGTEGEERAQLQELSAPLLMHVGQSLSGSFGEEDSKRAFDLLLTDVASHNADRRRCARRVLHDSIGKSALGEVPEPFAQSNCAWMINLLNVQHASLIVPDAIVQLARAASFERGRVLRFLVLALDKLTAYAEAQNLMKGFHFPSVMVSLISRRPTVFASTMASFSDLRSLAIRVVSEEFNKYTNAAMSDEDENFKDACDIMLCGTPPGNEGGKDATKVILPLSLLESSCVLLSIWLEEATEGEDSRAVESLVTMLMRTGGSTEDTANGEEESLSGLASAKYCATGKSAIPVESVSITAPTHLVSPQ
jgi:integrator complex subunit 1